MSSAPGTENSGCLSGWEVSLGELQAAVGEALAFLDQSLDAGFRPGMGHVVPDRFFWALPPADEETEGTEDTAAADGEPPTAEEPKSKGASRRVH